MANTPPYFLFSVIVHFLSFYITYLLPLSSIPLSHFLLFLFILLHSFFPTSTIPLHHLFPIYPLPPPTPTIPLPPPITPSPLHSPSLPPTPSTPPQAPCHHSRDATASPHPLPLPTISGDLRCDVTVRVTYGGLRKKVRRHFCIVRPGAR